MIVIIITKCLVLFYLTHRPEQFKDASEMVLFNKLKIGDPSMTIASIQHFQEIMYVVSLVLISRLLYYNNNKS